MKQKLNTGEKRKKEKAKRFNRKGERYEHISKGLPFVFDKEVQLFKTNDDEYIQMLRISGINLFGLKDDDQELRMHSLQKLFNPLVKSGQIYSYEIPADVEGYINDYRFCQNRLNIRDPHDLKKYEILEQSKRRLANTSITRELIDRCFLLILKDKSINRLNQKIQEAINQMSFNHDQILTTQEMINVIYSYYNPRDSVFNKKRIDMSDDIMDYIYPDMIGFVDHKFNQYISLNEIYCTTLYVGKFTKTNIGFLSILATYPDVEFSMHFEQASKGEITDTLNKSLKNTEKNLDKAKEHSEISKLRSEGQEMAELIDQINVDDDIPFYFSVMIRVKADTVENLAGYVDEIKKELTGAGFKMRSGIWQSRELFNTCAPICINQAPVYMKQTTNYTLATSYPFVFETLYDSTPMYDEDKKIISYFPPLYLGNTTPTGGVVFYDNFTKIHDRANYNEFIEGTSGFGKTTLMMNFIRFRHAVGYDQYVIDIEGRELNRLCYSLGGEVVNGANGDNGMINPMQVRINIPEDPKKPNQKISLDRIKPLRPHIRFLRSFLNSYKGKSEDIGKLHDSRIEDALIEVYEDYGIDFDTTAKEIMERNNDEFPIFSDVYDKLYNFKHNEEKRKIPDENMIKVINECIAFIKPIAVGADADIFNGYTNIDLTNSLICFDVSGLHDNTSSDILGTQYLNILSFIWSRVESSDGNKRIQVYEDEVAVIHNPKYIDIIIMNEDMERRFRKRMAGLTLGTQQINDMLKDSIKEHTRTLMTQSTYHFYFNTDADSLTYLKEKNLVPSSEIEWIQTAEIGQCFAKFGNQTSMRVNVTFDEQTLNEFKELKGESLEG